MSEEEAYKAGFYYGRLLQRAIIATWLSEHARHLRAETIVRSIQDMHIDGEPTEKEPGFGALTQEEKDVWKKV